MFKGFPPSNPHTILKRLCRYYMTVILRKPKFNPYETQTDFRK